MKKQNKVEKNPQQDTSDVIFKEPPKRKVSLKYKIFLVGFLVFFLAAFLTLVFRVRIFEKFDKAKVIGFVDDGPGYKITYVVNEKEYSVTRSFRDSTSTQYISGKLDYIIYQVSDPTYTFINRNIELIPFSIVSILSLLAIIPLIIYEIKKGCVP